MTTAPPPPSSTATATAAATSGLCDGALKAVILVGGPSRGTRFRPLSLYCPQPLFPIAGKPVLHHHLTALSEVQGLRDVFLIGFFEDSVFGPFLERVSVDFPMLNVRYLREYQALGTGGGLFHFRDEILRNQTRLVFVIHSDIITGCSLGSMIDFHLGQRKERDQGAAAAVPLPPPPPRHLCTLLTTKVADPTETRRYGCAVVSATTGEVLHYVEKPDFFVSHSVNAGVYLFEADVFSLLGSLRSRRLSFESLSLLAPSIDSLAVADTTDADDAIDSTVSSQPGPKRLTLEVDVLCQLTESRQLRAYESDAFWTPVKSATSSVQANSMALQAMQKRRPWILNGLKSGIVLGAVHIDPSAQIEPTAKIGPNVSIGRKVIIGAGVRIRDAIVLDGSEIRPYACITCAVIGWGSLVGKWARIEGMPSQSTVTKLMLNGQKTEAATIIGNNVTIKDEIIVRNCIVLPHKELKSSYHNDILM